MYKKVFLHEKQYYIFFEIDFGTFKLMQKGKIIAKIKF